MRIYDMQFTPQKPFDFALFMKGIFFAIEAKHQKSHLDFRRIKPHQFEHMRKVVKNGGGSFFIIRIEDPKRTHEKFRAFVISLEKMEELMETSTKQSCNAKDLEKWAEFEAKRIRLPSQKYTWNFPMFFEKFIQKGWDEGW